MICITKCWGVSWVLELGVQIGAGHAALRLLLSSQHGQVLTFETLLGKDRWRGHRGGDMGHPSEGCSARRGGAGEGGSSRAHLPALLPHQALFVQEADSSWQWG